MANTAFKSSSCSLKVATVILLLVLIVHVIGYSIPRWASVEFQLPGLSFTSKGESGYHVGLWQHCGCPWNICLCISRSNDPGWFKIVQATETLGLIGLIISMILSLVLLFNKQKKSYKCFNIFILITSGVLMLVGVIVFGLRIMSEFGKLKTLPDVDLIDFHDGYGKLGYAFILCVVASCLCLLVCTPLYIVDLCSYIPETPSEAPVHYSAQPPPPQGYVQGGQSAGYMPVYTNAQFGSPPAYYQPDNSGIPYKS